MTEVVLAERAARLAAKAHRGFWTTESNSGGGLFPLVFLVLLGLSVSFISISADVLKSSRSPWPTWTASALDSAGTKVRDYDVYDTRSQLYELMEDAAVEK